jgi:hypothetical protein
MFEHNPSDKVYDILSSHLISKKAVEILLRNPFSKADFEEFLSERQETIRNAIDDMLIKEKVVIPIGLQTLNDSIEHIELQIRDIILSKIGSGIEEYKAATPSHIQEKVDKRIHTELKKKPALTLEDFNNNTERLKYFDLFELYELVSSKQNWQIFEDVFRNKEQLQNRFNQLSTLRNCIRHSREVSAIEKLDGEASIAWFNSILK